MNRAAVVVPAHDEEELLPGCLEALAVAAAAVAVPVEVIVVADACTDRTAAVAAAAGAWVVQVAARNVGSARAAGMAHALRAGPGGLWLATTDADSRVPADWLSWIFAYAASGADVVAGAVLVDDWASWPASLPGHYQERYASAGDGHVHGANIGISAGAYLAAGGFPALTHDEDQALLAAARAAGARVVFDGGCPVRTSSRAVGRAPNGFAAYLGALAYSPSATTSAATQSHSPSRR